MSAPARIIPAIAHALEAGDLTAVMVLMDMLAKADLRAATQIRDAFTGGSAPAAGAFGPALSDWADWAERAAR